MPYPVPQRFVYPLGITWLQYHKACLVWMKQKNHPDLRKSNYNADRFLYDSNMRGHVQT